jgi:hypothetical protein
MRYALALLIVAFAGSAFADPAQEAGADLGGLVDPVCLFSGFAVSRNYTTNIAWAGGQSQFTTDGTARVSAGFNVLGTNAGGF